MNIAEWCIKNNRISGLLFILLFLLGIYTFIEVGKQEYPKISVKTAVITTYFPGASPQKVEELVTDKIEDQLSTIKEIENIRSQSMTGISIIQVDLYQKYRDIRPIWERLRYKVTDAISDLPEGCQTPIVNDEFGDDFPIVIALRADGFSFRDLKDFAEDFRDELLLQDMVAKVELYGIQDERIFVEFSNSRLAEFGYSPMMLAEALKTENIVKPSGDIKFEDERIIFEVSGNFESIEKLAKTTLRGPNSTSAIQLQDLAEIKRSYVDPPSPIARYQGERAIMVAINMLEGENVIKLGREIKKFLKGYEAKTPLGISFDVAVFQPKYVTSNIANFLINLLEAFIFVLIVVLVFVGIRMGLIVGALIPMAILPCIVVLPIFKLDLQMISVAALIIALGMLVDNGVVISENIIVRLNKGEERMKAISEAVKELTIPLLTASLTTIFAFLPIPMAKSNVGEFSESLFIVISTALLASWILSLSFIPMLCYYFLKPNSSSSGVENYEHPIYLFYKSFLLFSIKNSKIFIIVLCIALFVSLWGFKFVDKNFFPPNEREMFTIDFWMPYGVDISTTEKRLAELENFILEDEEGLATMSFVGSGGPRWYQPLSPEDPNSSYALVAVTTKTFAGSLALMERVRTYIEARLPEVRASISSLQNGPPVKTPIEIRISGSEIEKLYEIKEGLSEFLRENPGVINIRDDWGEWTKKIYVNTNQDKAKRAGLSSEDIALSLQSQFSGIKATEFRDGDEIIPIILRSKNYYRKDASNIEGINVFSSSTRNSIPISQVADIDLLWQASNIRRRNKSRTLTIKADLKKGYFAAKILAELKPKINQYLLSKDWPSGYKLNYGGEKEESSKAQESIFKGLPIALGLLVFVLMYQFNSIRKVLIIFLTIPPMMIGVTPGLYFTKSAFGFFAFLGLISLMGIIVNNAIMMIDRIDIERSSGKPLEEALISSALQRMRPILMTAVTTTIGLIPLSLQGGEMWRPMANTIIFGLMFSTLLTLVLCPMLYGIFYGAKIQKFTFSPQKPNHLG
jgi:multidrug efflux pump subunit AcrB